MTTFWQDLNAAGAELVLNGHSQVFTLAVPTEKENASTTEVELTPPAGFAGAL